MRLSRYLLIGLVLILALPIATVGTAPDAPLATITIDGSNDFPAATHLSELGFSWPTTGGDATHSDLCIESSTYHWIDGSWTDHSLSSGNNADLKELWVTWDTSFLYLGVQGPSAMMDTDLVDLFIAIDTNGSTSGNLGQSSTAWGKWIDFSGWSPEYFIAVAQARDVTGNQNPAGYAQLVPVGGTATDLTWGTQWSNSDWASGDNCNTGSNGFYNGGVFFEFRLTWSQIGFTGPPNPTTGGTPMNFAIYTTYNNSGYDGYDSAPGTGNGTTYEQIGDYKGDADHCASTSGADPVTGTTTETTCSYSDSDDTNGAGVSISRRNPGSDDADGGKETPDTIGEYFRVRNVGASSQDPLAVALAAFTAAATPVGVTLAWETVSETDNAGFNVYRAASEAGPWTRVNAALIPAATPGASSGHAYTWIDATATPGAAYVYRLEAVALDGSAEVLETLGVTYRPAQRRWLPLLSLRR